MRPVNSAEYSALEKLIDECGGRAVILAVSDIFGDKAEHIRANWQDDALGHDWQSAANLLGRTAYMPQIERLPHNPAG